MKNLLLVLSLVITASPAFASRARLEALGESKNGSYYINDGRDIFLNPAAINQYKKKLWLEAGTATGVADTSVASKVQGGFTNTFGDFTYGLYLGKESDRAANAIVTANGVMGANTFIPADHAFDFLIGGEHGVKWGADLFYAGGLNQNDLTVGQKKTASLLGVRLGVDLDALNIFTTVGITSDFKNATASATTDGEVKGNLNLDVGATYTMDDMTYLAKFTTYGSDLTGGTATAVAGTTATVTTTALGLGAGWKHEATKSVTMFSRIQADYQSDSTKTNVTTSKTWYNLPLVLGAEAAATSWLTVRGSISHSLIGQYQNGNQKISLDDVTAVAAGFGLNFGDLTIDALLGTSALTAPTSGIAGTVAATESSMGNSQVGTLWGLGATMMSRIAMTYNF